MQKPVLEKMVRGQMFERYIILNNQGNVGHVHQICDSVGNGLYCPERMAMAYGA